MIRSLHFGKLNMSIGRTAASIDIHKTNFRIIQKICNLYIIVNLCCPGLVAMVYGWIHFCSTFRSHLCATPSGQVSLTIHLTARENSPEDAAHKWRRNIEQKKFKYRSLSLSPENRGLHNAGRQSLSQFIYNYLNNSQMYSAPIFERLKAVAFNEKWCWFDSQLVKVFF